ncbi:MAG: hypothetical protein HY553_06220 [Elusimicrobia bacterium]|nr:hypothetical protein [Elusimicrobiota bacterium]
MSVCGHCQARRPPSGPCPRCGDDPAAPVQDLLDTRRYRGKALAICFAFLALAAWTAVYVVKHPGPPAAPGERWGHSLRGLGARLGLAPAAPPAPGADAPFAGATRVLPAPGSGNGWGQPPSGAPATRWVFEGRILDLATLTPVAQGRVALLGDGQSFEARSADDGAYRLLVPPDPVQAYTLTVPDARFLPRDFSGPPSMFDGKGELRSGLVENPDAADQPWLHPAWVGGASPVRRDIFLIRRTGGDPQ